MMIMNAWYGIAGINGVKILQAPTYEAKHFIPTTGEYEK